MAKLLNRLSALKVNSIKSSGYHHDGAGLYLQVTNSNNKSWIYRFTRMNKTKEMGLGSARWVSLSEARQKRDSLKKILIDGLDPLNEKNKKARLEAINNENSATFESCALSYIESHKPKWKHIKHSTQWLNSLKNYAFPIIGKIKVSEIQTDSVMKIIEPIWYKKTETASRVRMRIELILNWAAVKNFRAGDNPARWRGHLDQLLPKRSQIQKVKHMKALPYDQIFTFINELRRRNCIAALALEFIILTATRTNETLGAVWTEFDLQKKLWVIPSNRMKTKQEHRIPLSNRAMEILLELKNKSLSEVVFLNPVNQSRLSDGSLLALLKRMNYEVTTHGFRSTFRDWVSEETTHSREAAEASLAHALKDKVEAAYRRGDLFPKRQLLMDDWAEYCYSNKNILIKAGAIKC